MKDKILLFLTYAGEILAFAFCIHYAFADFLVGIIPFEYYMAVAAVLGFAISPFLVKHLKQTYKEAKRKAKMTGRYGIIIIVLAILVVCLFHINIPFYKIILPLSYIIAWILAKLTYGYFYPEDKEQPPTGF